MRDHICRSRSCAVFQSWFSCSTLVRAVARSSPNQRSSDRWSTPSRQGPHCTTRTTGLHCKFTPNKASAHGVPQKGSGTLSSESRKAARPAASSGHRSGKSWAGGCRWRSGKGTLWVSCGSAAEGKELSWWRREGMRSIFLSQMTKGKALIWRRRGMMNCRWGKR